jgi:uncharacterized protein (DUF1778 family)
MDLDGRLLLFAKTAAMKISTIGVTNSRGVGENQHNRWDAPLRGAATPYLFEFRRSGRDARRNWVDKLVPKWHRPVMEHAVEEARTRITARVSDRVRDTLEQAAELLGATVNQFVVQTAYVEAQRVIERESVIRLSQKDAHKVLALLDNPPKPNKRLKDAVKAFKGTVRA